MLTYNIKKTNNNEYKEINKSFKLNISKYVGDANTLYFDVEGQDIPYVVDYQMFFNVLVDQIQKGLLETLDYNDGVIKATFRVGNTIKNYTYDFNIKGFENTINVSKQDKLSRTIFKIVSEYKEDPNSHISSRQKYIWLIYDIIDGDRKPIINDQEELKKVFQVYNSEKHNILKDLLNNVEFYNNGVPVTFKGRVLEQKKNLIRNDILMQMNAAMAVFAQQNNASELYREYLNNIYIERREITFKYVDEDNNEIDPDTLNNNEGIKNIFDNALYNLREVAAERKNQILDKADDILTRIKKKN